MLAYSKDTLILSGIKIVLLLLLLLLNIPGNLQRGLLKIDYFEPPFLFLDIGALLSSHISKEDPSPDGNLHVLDAFQIHLIVWIFWSRLHLEVFPLLSPSTGLGLGQHRATLEARPSPMVGILFSLSLQSFRCASV